MIFSSKIKYIKQMEYFSKEKVSGNSYVVLIKETTFYMFGMSIYKKQEVSATTATL